MIKPICILLFAFGIYEVSKTNGQPESSDVARATFIFMSWIKLYLKNPEFARNLDAALTKEQQRNLHNICVLTYYCFSTNIENEPVSQACVENFMKNYRTKDVDYFIDVIRKTENRLPSNKDVSREYEIVFRFYIMLVKKTDRGLKLLNQFTVEEKKFIETLVEKYNRWFFHIDAVDAFADFAAFQRDNEMIHQVSKKVRQIKLWMKNLN